MLTSNQIKPNQIKSNQKGYNIKQRFKNTTDVEDKVGAYGDQMSFDEIGKELGISGFQAKKIFNTAMRKLQHPSNARRLWNYNQIGEKPNQSENGGTTL